MSTPVFYIPPDRIRDRTAVLSGEELHHAAHVLRLKPGDGVVLIDGLGTRHSGELTGLGRREGMVTIASSQVEPEPAFRLTVAMGIVGGERFEWAIQKATELGVAGIVPLITARSDGRVKVPWKRLERLRRVALAACKQCGRARLPILHQPVAVEEIDPRRYDACVTFWEAAPGISLARALSGLRPPERCLAVIGPVGGLTHEEATGLVDRGAVVAGLGPRVLRTETAVVAAVTLLQHRWGDMG